MTHRPPSHTIRRHHAGDPRPGADPRRLLRDAGRRPGPDRADVRAARPGAHAPPRATRARPRPPPSARAATSSGASRASSTARHVPSRRPSRRPRRPPPRPPRRRGRPGRRRRLNRGAGADGLQRLRRRHGDDPEPRQAQLLPGRPRRHQRNRRRRPRRLPGGQGQPPRRRRRRLRGERGPGRPRPPHARGHLRRRDQLRDLRALAARSTTRSGWARVASTRRGRRPSPPPPRHLAGPIYLGAGRVTIAQIGRPWAPVGR